MADTISNRGDAEELLHIFLCEGGFGNGVPKKDIFSNCDYEWYNLCISLKSSKLEENLKLK